MQGKVASVRRSKMTPFTALELSSWPQADRNNAHLDYLPHKYYRNMPDI